MRPSLKTKAININIQMDPKYSLSISLLLYSRYFFGYTVTYAQALQIKEANQIVPVPWQLT